MQHYIDETTLEVFGYKAREGLNPCNIPTDVQKWDITTHAWVDDAIKVAEKARGEAKTARDEALQANTYTLGDGSVYQVRPQDLGNLQLAISRGVDKKWTMANNAIRLTTIAELTEIMSNGIDQGEAIWDAFHTAVEGL